MNQNRHQSSPCHLHCRSFIHLFLRAALAQEISARFGQTPARQLAQPPTQSALTPTPTQLKFKYSKHPANASLLPARLPATGYRLCWPLLSFSLFSERLWDIDPDVKQQSSCGVCMMHFSPPTFSLLFGGFMEGSFSRLKSDITPHEGGSEILGSWSGSFLGVVRHYS